MVTDESAVTQTNAHALSEARSADRLGHQQRVVLLKGGGAVVSDDYRILATGLKHGGRHHRQRRAGLEFGFAPNWSVGVEYDHIFLEDRTHTFLTTGAIFRAGALFGTDTSARTSISSPFV